MITLYRGHWIILLQDDCFSAEMTEIRSRAPLPTRVRAELGEGPEVCLERARHLIDVYLASIAAMSGACTGAIALDLPSLLV